MTIEVKGTTMNTNAATSQGSRRITGHGLLLIGLLPLVGIAGCGGAVAEDTQDEAAFSRIINVEVASVETTTFAESIRLTGTAQANRDVTVSAEENGVIREILIDKGTPVREGQPMFRMDSDLLEAQVDQASAMANLSQEAWDRRRRLYEEDQIGSELVYLEAKYAAEQASANLRFLEERLERTVIRAPISGILDSRQIEVGTMVAAGTPVARIVDNNPVKITAGVPERYAAEVRAGADAVVTFDVIADEEFHGRISYAGAAVNRRNRTFPVELVLQNPGGFIKPEMVANLSIVTQTHENAIVVPQEALVRTEEGFVVFVVEDENGVSVAQARTVELGAGQMNQVHVLSGLDVGDRLIVVGQQAVASDDRVNLVTGG